MALPDFVVADSEFLREVPVGIHDGLRVEFAEYEALSTRRGSRKPTTSAQSSIGMLIDLSAAPTS